MRDKNEIVMRGTTEPPCYEYVPWGQILKEESARKRKAKKRRQESMTRFERVQTILGAMREREEIVKEVAEGCGIDEFYVWNGGNIDKVSDVIIDKIEKYLNISKK